MELLSMDNKSLKIRKSLLNNKIKLSLDNFRDMLQFKKDKIKKKRHNQAHNLKVKKSKDKDQDKKTKKNHKFKSQSRL